MRYSDEHIDQFISGRLNQEEEDAFKKAVDENEELLQRLTERTIRLYGQQKLRARLKDIDTDLDNTDPSNKKRNWRLF